MRRNLSLHLSAVFVLAILLNIEMMISLLIVGTGSRGSAALQTRSLYQFARSNTALRAVKAPQSKTTGAFKTNLPDTFPSQTHYKRALRALKLIKADYSVKNIRNQERKLTAQSMDALMKGLTVPISEIINAYSTTFRNLHPFEVRKCIFLGHVNVKTLFFCLCGNKVSCVCVTYFVRVGVVVVVVYRDI